MDLRSILISSRRERADRFSAARIGTSDRILPQHDGESLDTLSYISTGDAHLLISGVLTLLTNC